MYNYEIIIYWSVEDSCYIAELPELRGCIAHGKDEYSALKNLQKAKELWIETAKELKEPIPTAKGRLVFA